MTWKLGIAKNLKVQSADKWDGTASENELLAWSGVKDTDTKNVSFSKLRQGYLFYNDALEGMDSPNKTQILALTSFPLVRIIAGKPVVIREALSAALSFLNRTPPDVPKGIDESLINQGRALVEEYIGKYSPDEKSISSAEANLGEMLNSLYNVLATVLSAPNGLDALNNAWMYHNVIENFLCPNCQRKIGLLEDGMWRCNHCGQGMMIEKSYKITPMTVKSNTPIIGSKWK